MELANCSCSTPVCQACLGDMARAVDIEALVFGPAFRCAGDQVDHAPAACDGRRDGRSVADIAFGHAGGRVRTESGRAAGVLAMTRTFAPLRRARDQVLPDEPRAADDEHIRRAAAADNGRRL